MDVSEKSGTITFEPLWNPNFMQEMNRNDQAVQEISQFDGFTQLVHMGNLD